MKNRRITIKDIAKLAGVSHSTVSRSLNDHPGISQKTKDRIRRLAKDMQFEFNAGARSLSTRQTGTVAVIFAESPAYVGTLLYLNQLLQGIRRAFEQQSIDCIITYPQNSVTMQSNIQRMIHMQKIDGLLIIHPEVPSEDWGVIEQYNIPNIALHFKPKSVSYRSMNYVFIDHELGGYQAAEKLIQNGRKRILNITEDSYNLQFIERTAGYKKAMADYNLPVNQNMIIKGECSFDFGYQTIMDHRGIMDEIDGVFAHADIVALGVLEALKDLHKRIPEDVAVIGYDDIELSAAYRPGLTTVHQPREEMIKLGCERLIEMMSRENEQPPMQVILEPEIVFRDTCKDVAATQTSTHT